MELDDGLGLTPRKVEYLKFIFEKGGRVKTNEIACRFGVDPSTITKTIADLSSEGLIRHVPYRGVSLTPAGKRYAGFLIKRHRILSLALTQYGISGEQACREAARFESFVSKDTVDTMCRTMGHPSLGICGEITHDSGCRGDKSGI